jgi:hypothetical protein
MEVKVKLTMSTWRLISIVAGTLTGSVIVAVGIVEFIELRITRALTKEICLMKKWVA